MGVEMILHGNLVSLMKIRDEDTDSLVKWRNSAHVKENLYSQEDVTPEQHREWLRTKVDSGQCVQFVIYSKHDKVPVGTTFLKNIEAYHSRAEFGIFIGELGYLGKGLGGDATRLIVKYGFEELKLNKIYLTVFEHNYPAIRSYESVGFRRTGLMSEEYRRNDKWLDVVYMEILSSVFCGTSGRSALLPK